MTPDSRFTVSSSAELIAVVPYLLGFHPADSLVIVAMRDTRVLFAGRQDLPPPEHVEEAARLLTAVVARQRVDRATLIGYGAEPSVTPAVLATANALRHSGITVHELLRVTDGQFGSYFCADPACCPSPCPPADNRVAASAILAGEVALPDRSALVERLAPVTGAEREAMVDATERAHARLAGESGGGEPARTLRRAGRQAVRDAEHRYRSGRGLTDDEVAWLGLLLVDPQVRDYAWERTGEEDWRVSLWTDVLRRVEPGYVPAPAGLLSFAAWRHGMGALALVAVDRALAGDPDYRMARQMEEVLGFGLSPKSVDGWPDVRRSAFDPAADHPDGDVVRQRRASAGSTGGRGGRGVKRRKPRRRAV